MRIIYTTAVFVQTLLLIAQVLRIYGAESAVAQKTTSHQPESEQTTQKPTETTKPPLPERTSQSSLLKSSQWNVKTLKSTDFATEVNEKPPPCERVRVAELVERRKQAYNNDASVIQFVSAHPLPANTSSLKDNRCDAQTRRDKGTKRRRPKVLVPAKETSKITEPSKPPCRAGDECDINNRMPEAGPHDYLISSVEYYDEDPLQDIQDCPEDMEIVTLEIEQLRQYDYQCETITKWVGLD